MTEDLRVEFAVPVKYEHIDFTPPEGARRQAARGLELRRKFGRGGTMVGVARARDISNGAKLSPSTIKRMYSYFSRHEVDKKGQNWASKSDPSNGYIAWLLWGGEPGKSWSKSVYSQMKTADEKEKNLSNENMLKEISG